jgi:hypothetical protein
LSVTPAGSLRLWQASSETDNGVNIGFEPDMQADQWGAAASATSGVRSNVTLDSGRCQLNFRCSFLPTLASRQSEKNPEKWLGLMLKSKCCTRAVRFNGF